MGHNWCKEGTFNALDVNLLKDPFFYSGNDVGIDQSICVLPFEKLNRYNALFAIILRQLSKFGSKAPDLIHNYRPLCMIFDPSSYIAIFHSYQNFEDRHQPQIILFTVNRMF